MGEGETYHSNLKPESAEVRVKTTAGAVLHDQSHASIRVIIYNAVDRDNIIVWILN